MTTILDRDFDDGYEDADFDTETFGLGDGEFEVDEEDGSLFDPRGTDDD